MITDLRRLGMWTLWTEINYWWECSVVCCLYIGAQTDRRLNCLSTSAGMHGLARTGYILQVDRTGENNNYSQQQVPLGHFYCLTHTLVPNISELTGALYFNNAANCSIHNCTLFIHIQIPYKYRVAKVGRNSLRSNIKVIL